MADLPPKSPRTKKPKPGLAKGNKIVQQNLSGSQRISKGVPDKIKLAMADAIMAFSDMEMSAELFIWDLLGFRRTTANLLRGSRRRTKSSWRKSFPNVIACRLIERANDRRAWIAIRNAIEARNKMVHGVWMTIDLRPPSSFRTGFQSSLDGSTASIFHSTASKLSRGFA